MGFQNVKINYELKCLLGIVCKRSDLTLYFMIARNIKPGIKLTDYVPLGVLFETIKCMNSEEFVML